MPSRRRARFRVSAKGPLVLTDTSAPGLPALDIFEVAEKFKCSHMTVRRLIANRRLPAVKVGVRWRIRPEDVDAYLRGDLSANADDYVAEVLAHAPRLTEEQRAKLAELLRPVRVSGGLDG